jgi:DNA polymerase III epsilon subunit-like protein
MVKAALTGAKTRLFQHFNFPRGNMPPIVFYDLETSGLEEYHEITQAAFAVFDGNRLMASLEIKVKFDVSKASPEALQVNHYTPEAWVDAYEPVDAAKTIQKFLKIYAHIEQVGKKSGKPFKVAQLAGFNNLRFDADKLQKFFKGVDVFLPASFVQLDVLQLALWFYYRNPDSKPENMKLETLCQVWGVKISNAHDALSDTIATGELCNAILNYSPD